MASTFSTDLKLELMATGENSGTWGDKTNTNLNLLQQAIAGFESIALTSTNTTLAMTNATISDARNAVIKFTGTLTANSTVHVATGIEKTYILDNSTSGNFTLALNQVGGTSAIFGGTDKSSKIVYLTGTNVVDLGIVNLQGTQTLTNKTLTSPIINNGTATTIVLTSPIIDVIDDANGNEEIIFTTTASAVNELTVANSATGNNPNVSATGGDTNVGINLTPKGTGAITFNGMGKVEEVKEKITISATAATGTINFDTDTQAVLFFTSNASANFTVNLRGSASTTLNDKMSTGESLTVVFLVTQGSTAFFNNVVQVDGVTVTAKYQGGSAPTSGNINSIDSYTYTVIKTGNAAFTVLAAQIQFK